MGLLALQSAETTQIPLRLALTAVVIGILILAIYGIRKSWTKKAAGQQQISSPALVPESFEPIKTFSGRYLATTYANDWLKRIVVHGLGLPSRCELSIGANGIRFSLNKSEFYIPREDIVEIRADRAIAGRAFEKDGIAVIVWRLSNLEIATGFRADTNAQHIELLKMAIAKQESGK